MNRLAAIVVPALLAMSLRAMADEPIRIDSPGFPPSAVTVEGRLQEDWGAFSPLVSGQGVTSGRVTVESVKLDGQIPAARVVADRGAVKVTSTIYRAPVFPAGVDVFRVCVEETRDRPAQVVVAVQPPDGAQMGTRTVRLAGRTVLTLPSETSPPRTLRAWGYCDEATSLPAWLEADEYELDSWCPREPNMSAVCPPGGCMALVNHSGIG